MCGIAGTLQFKGSQAPVSKLENAVNRQANRGPDGSGIYQIGNMALGHRRLKIFDLNDRAAQPMIDKDLGLSIVFNGAIYNFKDIKTELESKGYNFTSSSDTEVILKAFNYWGDDCVHHFNGMFAFAIWDRDNHVLTIIRDRLGIKPLYYSINNQSFNFASTLQALLEFGDIDTSINPESLHYYLTFHAVPEPLTLLNGVKKLPSGSILKVYSSGKIEERKYWQLNVNSTSSDKKISDQEWLEIIQGKLKKSVEMRLDADVPVGLLLSGGLDSSLILALAQQKAGNLIETFSIGFESIGNYTGNEFYYSDIAAKHFKSKHHQIYFSNKEMVDSLEECVKQMSEPMPSHDNIGFYLLSKEVSKHVKVVLSGQGADEVFGGYGSFQNLLNNKDESDIDTYSRNFFDMDFNEYKLSVNPKWQTENLSKNFVEKEFKINGSSDLIDNALYLDTSFALTNGPVLRVDNQTMAFGLEARVPFLDHTLVETASKMPKHLKINNGGKAIIKSLGRKLLPLELVVREKGYFPVPILQHLEGRVLELMKDVFSKKKVKERGIFNYQRIKDLLSNPKKYMTPLGGSTLWQVGLMEYWLQLNNL